MTPPYPSDLTDAGLKYFAPRLKTIWPDAAYRGQELAGWCKVQDDRNLDVVERAAGGRGFAVVPKAGSLSGCSDGCPGTDG